MAAFKNSTINFKLKIEGEKKVRHPLAFPPPFFSNFYKRDILDFLGYYDWTLSRVFQSE